MKLSPMEKQHYLNLKKGYEGEVKFDSMTVSLDNKFYILNDLLLESNSKTFQIDTLVITQETIIPCEVKNYEGDYYYQDDNFYICTTQKEITNPLHQLSRSKTLLLQLLQKHKFHFPIESFLIFINPEFFLYQAPYNKQIIFTPQLNSFLKNLSAKPSKLTENHRKLADHLLKAHITEPPFSQIPAYDYGQLRIGITCATCNSFLTTVGEKKIICDECGNQEDIQSAVVRGVEELRLLFPDIKITTKVVYEWCRLDEHKRKIRRTLLKNYKIMGHGKYSYYV
jgi:hypothetical protein